MNYYLNAERVKLAATGIHRYHSGECIILDDELDAAVDLTAALLDFTLIFHMPLLSSWAAYKHHAFIGYQRARRERANDAKTPQS